ncbi:kinase-like protein [Aureobasidium pullulans]|nr:kinase-like protein [Aureobasidium pullulans]CAC9885681.1 unnamed protein product [Aureobasidium pullulans]
MGPRPTASSLSLESFLKLPRDYRFVHPDGSPGPLVCMGYNEIPEDIGDVINTRIQAFSSKSIVLSAQLITNDDTQDWFAAKIMYTPENIEKLKNELEILGKLRHKHVAAVLGSFSRTGPFGQHMIGILVFPLAVQNLQQLLENISTYNKNTQNEGRSTWHTHQHTEKLLSYFACLCRTVLYLHKQHRPVKHRDIKPANILIDKDDGVILADFDISKAYDDVKEAITYSSPDGTIMYSSKHVGDDSDDDDNPKDNRRGLEWDIISLGFVFLEIATVLFGRTLEEMRKPMEKHRRGQKKPTVIYSEALKARHIHNWLETLRDTATDTPWRLPLHLAQSIESDPGYVDDFLKAIEDMMSAEQNSHGSLERAWEVFGRLSDHCPIPSK